MALFVDNRLDRVWSIINVSMVPDYRQIGDGYLAWKDSEGGASAGQLYQETEGIKPRFELCRTIRKVTLNSPHPLLLLIATP